eukprot:49072-Eustigmatos_ZCMA.PRE.1
METIVFERNRWWFDILNRFTSPYPRRTHRTTEAYVGQHFPAPHASHPTHLSRASEDFVKMEMAK